MSVDPQRGPAYSLPSSDTPPPPEFSGDSGFSQGPRNPDGSEIGPLYVSPEGKQWIQENVYDQGLYIDWGTREIFDADTGEVKGTVPTSVPRMI
jgi:hypothetical protein